MKKLLMATLACVMSAAVCAQSVKPAIPRDENLEVRIEKTLQGMTLDEKVGQMLEINIDVVGSYKPDKKGNKVFQLDMNKLDTIIGKYKVGSFLNCPGKGLTVAEWQKVIPTIQKLSMKYMKIPTIYGLDNNHGSTYVLGGTLFPQPINLGALELHFVDELKAIVAVVCTTCGKSYNRSLKIFYIIYRTRILSIFEYLIDVVD